MSSTSFDVEVDDESQLLTIALVREYRVLRRPATSPGRVGLELAVENAVLREARLIELPYTCGTQHMPIKPGASASVSCLSELLGRMTNTEAH